MRAVLLVADEPIQRVLAHRLSAVADVRGIVVSANQPRRARRRSTRALLGAGLGRLLAQPLRRAWFDMQAGFERRFPDWPRTQLVRVANANDEPTSTLIATLRPDLVAVSGTNLIARSLLELHAARGRFVNLHTGLSPYVNGGPNCTNWCLAMRWFHWIGNSVMWLDPGIDSGELIATERTPLTGNETLTELHQRVIEHAHDLYSRVLAAHAGGNELPRVSQASVGSGRTFYNADWGPRQMLSAIFNHRRSYRASLFESEGFRASLHETRLVSLHPTGQINTSAP